MWIGTTDGLQRYDGVSFHYFFHDPDLPESTIGANDIARTVAEDDRGRIWITLATAGISRYDPRTQSVTNFNYTNGKLPAQGADATGSLLITPDGNAYFTSYHGLVMIDTLDQVHDLVVSGSDKEGAPRPSRGLHLQDNNWLWVATTRGFACYNLQTKQWEHRLSNPRDLGILNRTNSIHGSTLAGSTLWFGTWHPPAGSQNHFLYSFDLERNTLDSVPIAPGIERASFFSDIPTVMTTDHNGLLWIGTEQLGLLSYDVQTKAWTRYQHSAEWSGSLQPNIVRAIYEDRQDNLWIGTEGGLSLLSRDRQYFTNYTTLLDGTGKQHKLETKQASIVIGPLGDIWLGEMNFGLTHISPAMSIINARMPVPGTSGPFPLHTPPRHAEEEFLLCQVWSEGLFRIDHKTGSTIKYLDGASGAPELRHILKDRNGNYWAWGWGRFGKLNIETGAYDFVEMPVNRHGNADLVWNAVEDLNGDLWLGMGQTGLLRLDPIQMKIVDRVNRDSISTFSTAWQLLHSAGKIYFAFDSRGLGILNIETGAIQRFTKKDGLCSDDINGFVQDASGDVWIYSASGMSWFDEDNQRFKTFRIDDGMISESISDAALMPDGRIALVTTKGLVTFMPHALKQSGKTLTPSIRSLTVYDELITLHNRTSDETIEVKWNKNYLRAEFSALEFFDPEKIRFAYKLEGADPEWNFTDYRPVATYTNLRGGDYELVVKCTNIDGEWGPELRIPVFVSTPFFRQAWFYGLLLLAAIGIVYLVYRYQLNRRLAIERVRNRLARDLHDDIGSTLSSISIYSNVAQKKVDNSTEESKQLLNRIGTNAREMMESMDDIVWTIDPAHDEFGHVLARMRAHALPVLDAQDIRLDLQVDEDIKSVRLDMVKRRNLYLIFKEAINNLAKYSAATVAQVVITRDGSKLRMTVNDNGKGFDNTESNDRHGLRNMQARAAEVKGTCVIRSGQEQGTLVEVEIPL